MENLLRRFYGLVVIIILFPTSHSCGHRLSVMTEGKNIFKGRQDRPGSSQGCFNLVITRLGLICNTSLILYG